MFDSMHRVATTCPYPGSNQSSGFSHHRDAIQSRQIVTGLSVNSTYETTIGRLGLSSVCIHVSASLRVLVSVISNPATITSCSHVPIIADRGASNNVSVIVDNRF